MGFMADYKRIYTILTGQKLRWRGTFGFSYSKLGIADRANIGYSLQDNPFMKYEDPELFVRLLRYLHRCLHDPTLRMITNEGLGDFSELVEYEGEPAEFEIGTESWHELSYPEGDIGEFGEEAIDDDEEDKDEMPEGSWDGLWQEIYRCEKEEEAKDREGLPGSFGELMSTILTRY